MSDLRPPILRRLGRYAVCDVCGKYNADHDRELHRVVALEQIAAALEKLVTPPAPIHDDA